MALDRLLPVSTTPGAVTGDAYMDAVQEEVTGLWDRAIIKLSGVSGTDTITATFTPALTAGLIDGMNAILRPAATNTGPVTLNGVSVRDAEGTALAAGALRINALYLLSYQSSITAWCVVSYVPAAAVPVGSKLIKTQTASGSSSLDFVNGVSDVVLDDTYDSYKIVLSNLQAATDDVELWLRIGTGAGPTYQTSLYDWAFSYQDANGTLVAQALTSQTRINLGTHVGAGGALGNLATESVSGEITFDNPENATFHKLFGFHILYTQASASFLVSSPGIGAWRATTPITAVRIMMESGNIASGRATLYGLTKA